MLHHAASHSLDRVLSSPACLPQDELQRQRAQVRECSGVSPAQLLQEQQFRKEIKERCVACHLAW